MAAVQNQPDNRRGVGALHDRAAFQRREHRRDALRRMTTSIKSMNEWTIQRSLN